MTAPPDPDPALAKTRAAIPRQWVWLPALGLLVAVVSLGAGARLLAIPGFAWLWPAFEFAVLMATVFAAVHHAEDIAHALGEPFGTLVLTMSVTVIECALILSIMLGGDGSPTLARDTTMAVVMVILNFIVGLCILAGGLRYGEQGFQVPGARSYLMVLIPFAVLTLVLPNYTSTTTGPTYAPVQVAFVSVATLALYAMFLYVQTVRHTEYFTLDEGAGHGGAPDVPLGRRDLLVRFALLCAALVAIVLLSKAFSVTIDKVVTSLGAPVAVVGLVVAMLVLLPESLAALGAARANRMQSAINLALGSSLATIGLTIPAVGLLSIVLDIPLTLGLEPAKTVLLVLTLAVAMLTFGGGRTNILPGFVHLMLGAVYVFLVFVP